jgi:hypothetical protein
VNTFPQDGLAQVSVKSGFPGQPAPQVLASLRVGWKVRPHFSQGRESDLACSPLALLRFWLESVIAQCRPVDGGHASCFLRTGVNVAPQMVQDFGSAPVSRPFVMCSPLPIKRAQASQVAPEERCRPGTFGVAATDIY